MTELEALRAQVAALTQQVQALQDYVEIVQLVSQYGPSVDSGSTEAAAGLWTEDGIFDVVGYGPFTGRKEIAGMVNGAGHQYLIQNGCGHVLTVPHVVVNGDEATGRSYALNIRWDAKAEHFWVARVSANTWHWRRAPEGWRVVKRVNANLDGTPGPRAMLAPAPGV